MKTKSALTILVAIFVLSMANEAGANTTMDLKQYQWTHRLILLFTPSLAEAEYLELKEDLSSQNDEIIDRDLLVFHILEGIETRLGSSLLPIGAGDSLRKKFGVKSGRFTVLLIGKDGEVKLRREDNVELAEIFSLIDTMPMRQQEMREKSQQR
jgi:hypothetical protein